MHVPLWPMSWSAVTTTLLSSLICCSSLADVRSRTRGARYLVDHSWLLKVWNQVLQPVEVFDVACSWHGSSVGTSYSLGDTSYIRGNSGGIPPGFFSYFWFLVSLRGLLFDYWGGITVVSQSRRHVFVLHLFCFSSGGVCTRPAEQSRDYRPLVSGNQGSGQCGWLFCIHSYQLFLIVLFFILVCLFSLLTC